MARDQIAINFTANVSEVARGTATMQRDLAKTSDAIEDVGKSGERAADDIQDATRDISRDAERAGHDVEHEVGGGFDKASDKAGQFGGAVQSVLSGDVAGAAQDAAGALSALGPVGAAAGLVGAAGIGVVLGAIQSQQEAVDRLKEKFADAYKSAAQDGRDYLDEAQIINAAQDILFGTGDDKGSKKKAADDAKQTGLDILTIARAQAGSASDLDAVLAAINLKQDAIKDSGQQALDAQTGAVTQAGAQSIQLQQIADRYGSIRDVSKDAADSANLADELRKQSAAAQAQADGDAAGRQQALIQSNRDYRAQASAPLSMSLNVDDSPARAAFERLLGQYQNKTVTLRAVVEASDKLGRQIID